MPQSFQCPSCVHYKPGLVCKAFPMGIPEEILSGEYDHRDEFPGDNGIRWEKRDDWPEDEIDGTDEGDEDEDLPDTETE